MLRPAVGKIVAVDGSNYHMPKPEPRHRAADIFRLIRVERARQTRAHIAEGAGARAGVAHNHHRGVTMGPAFPDIRATRLFADGVQPEFADDLARLLIFAAARRLDANPVRLAKQGGIGPV